jgi:hypothetical protein
MTPVAVRPRSRVLNLSNYRKISCPSITFHNQHLSRCDHLPPEVSELSFSWQPSDVLDATLASNRKSNQYILDFSSWGRAYEQWK